MHFHSKADFMRQFVHERNLRLSQIPKGSIQFLAMGQAFSQEIEATIKHLGGDPSVKVRLQ